MSKEADLPKELYETSGLETMDGNIFWTHNDGGHGPMLYALNASGEIIHKLTIQKAKNVDWEDLAFDPEGNLYIADIGNNLNKRRDLVIYKIKPTLDSSEVVVREKIRINYKDQLDYPPSRSEMRYDAEAIVVHSDSIYIFTKNRTEPYDRTIYCYAVPAKEGHYMPEIRDRFTFEKGGRYRTWVTAADYDQNSETLYLLTSDRVWVFDSSNADSVFTSTNRQINLGSFSQKEGLCIDGSGKLWITDEVFKLMGGNLYGYRTEQD